MKNIEPQKAHPGSVSPVIFQPQASHGHGGARKGSGRKVLPADQKRKAVTVKILPGANAELALLAENASVSNASVLEWFALSPEAEKARKMCRAKADAYVANVKGGSAALLASKAALHRQVK
jgi:hypothetical protein